MYENVDGRGVAWDMHVVSKEFLWPRSFFLGDVDSDGDVDFFSPTLENMGWYENRRIGDSNNDGIFNSSDLVAVFQAGKYHDGKLGNATFDEGDWNQDGGFDSSDLVFAFQAGTYVAGAQPLAVEIAATIDGDFAVG